MSCNVYDDNIHVTLNALMMNITDPETFDCVLEPSCPNLDDTVESGKVVYSRPRQSSGRYSAGTTATVECAEGYRGGDITCQTDGNWSGPLPSCTIVDCGSPPTLDNGRIAMQDMTTFDSVVTYECNENYFFDNGTKSSRTCLSSGEWSNEDIQCNTSIREPPECDCEEPDERSNNTCSSEARVPIIIGAVIGVVGLASGAVVGVLGIVIAVKTKRSAVDGKKRVNTEINLAYGAYQPNEVLPSATQNEPVYEGVL